MDKIGMDKIGMDKIGMDMINWTESSGVLNTHPFFPCNLRLWVEIWISTLLQEQYSREKLWKFDLPCYDENNI